MNTKSRNKMLSQFSINQKSVKKIQDESWFHYLQQEYIRKNHTCAVLYRIVKK